MKRRKQQRLALGFGVVLVLAIFGVVSISKMRPSETAGSPTAAQCTVAPFRQDEAADLIKGGAVIAYQRVVGPQCVDELYAIYPDGRFTGTDGVNTVEKQITPAEVDEMLVAITLDHKWFTNEIYDTYLMP